MRNRKHSGIRWGSAAATLLMAGCMANINTPNYPVEWPPASTERIGACPVLSGTYVGAGSLYIDSGIRCPRPQTQEGLWSCDLQLAPNLGVASHAVTVEIEQLDDEAINVRLLDEIGATKEMRTLHLDKEYRCDEESLYFASNGLHASFAPAPLPSGFLSQHSRRFNRDAKGELVMTVRDDMQALLLLLIGVVTSATSHVRWIPAGAPSCPAAKLP